MGAEFGEVLSIKQMVYNNLKSRIISGDLKPGSRLLEGELSEAMKISRAPIREALNMLEKDGFATIVPRKGAIVSEITEENVFAIWEFRLLMEPYIAKRTLSYISDQEINELEAEIQYVQDHPDDFERYMESDLKLHDLLEKYLDNSFMKKTLDNMKAHSLRIRWADEYTEEGTRLSETSVAVNQEHMDIVKAMKARDADQLCDAVKNHVLCSAGRITKACNMELTESQKQQLHLFKLSVQA